jgi:hypothetical protein
VSYSPVYDRIGPGYTGGRREEPRIAAALAAAIGDADSVLNVGAGTGSYEPRDRPVVNSTSATGSSSPARPLTPWTTSFKLARSQAEKGSAAAVTG